jgi:parvulin-like peptidyl-prolyl isomerase
VKKFAGLVFIIAVLLTQPLFGEIVDRIVAVVNDEIITMSDLNIFFEPYRKNIEENYREPEREKVLADARATLLRTLIDASLIEQEAKKNGISVRDEEVTAAINDALKRRNISAEDFARGLAGEGLSLESYKKDFKKKMVRMRLVTREVKSKIIITDKEIGEYYSSHRQDYEGKEAVRIKQLLLIFPKGVDEETKEKLGKDMENIHERLKNGEPFDMLAANYSQGPVAAAGSDLGFIEKGMMLPEVENAAFNLGKDEISGVIRSAVGFHIIKVVDKRGAGLKPIETVREEIQAKIEEQKTEKKFEEWLESLRKKSYVEIKL